MKDVKWTRAHAGRYEATVEHDGRVLNLVVREYVAGDWELTINGQHGSYSGTKRELQARINRMLKEEAVS